MRHVFLLDRRGKIKWMSDSINDRDYHENHTIFDPLLPTDRQEAEECFAACIMKGVEREFRAGVKRVVSGEIVPVHCRLYPANLDLSEIAAVLIWHVIPENYDEFSDSDLLILRLLAGGRAIKEIASRCDRSVSTIESRLRTLKERLGAATLPHLTARAIQLGLIPLETLPRRRGTNGHRQPAI